MSVIFATRMDHVKKSFIREILKVTVNPEIISFAGGLPNPESFPVDGIRNACKKVLDTDGKNALQYSTTEGYLPLREYIAGRYLERKTGFPLVHQAAAGKRRAGGLPGGG